MSYKYTGRKDPGSAISRNPSWLSANNGLLISCPMGRSIVICDVLVSSGSGKKLGTGANGGGDLIAYVSAGSSHSKIPIAVPAGESVYTDADAYITITYYFSDGYSEPPVYGPEQEVCVSGAIGYVYPGDNINGTYVMQASLQDGKVQYWKADSSAKIQWFNATNQWVITWDNGGVWNWAYSSTDDVVTPYEVSSWSAETAGNSGWAGTLVAASSQCTTPAPTTTPFPGADCNTNISSLPFSALPNGPITNTWKTTGTQTQAVWNIASVFEFTVTAGQGAGKKHIFNTMDAGVEIDAAGTIISMHNCNNYGLPGPYGGMHNFDIWLCLHTQAGVLVDSNDDYPTQGAGYDSDKYGAQVSGTLSAGNYYLSVVAYSATGGPVRCPANPSDTFPADYIIAYGYDDGSGSPTCGATCNLYTPPTTTTTAAATTTTAAAASSFCVVGSPYSYANTTWTPTGQTCAGKITWTNGGTGSELLYMFYDDSVVPDHWCVTQAICDCSDVWFRSDNVGNATPWDATWVTTGFGTVTEGACSSATTTTTTVEPTTTTTTTTAAPTTTTTTAAATTTTTTAAATTTTTSAAAASNVCVAEESGNEYYWALNAVFTPVVGANAIVDGKTQYTNGPVVAGYGDGDGIGLVEAWIVHESGGYWAIYDAVNGENGVGSPYATSDDDADDPWDASWSGTYTMTETSNSTQQACANYPSNTPNVCVDASSYDEDGTYTPYQMWNNKPVWRLLDSSQSGYDLFLWYDSNMSNWNISSGAYGDAAMNNGQGGSVYTMSDGDGTNPWDATWEYGISGCGSGAGACVTEGSC